MYCARNAGAENRPFNKVVEKMDLRLNHILRTPPAQWSTAGMLFIPVDAF